MQSATPYRGRLAPSPTGHLHAGHAITFWRAQERCRALGGKLILRIEDLDRARCRPEFYTAFEEDLCWFGLAWTKGHFGKASDANSILKRGDSCGIAA